MIASLAVVTGLVLIGTAFVGGARWLIVPALALVLPLGIVAAADIDLDGGVGDREYHPATVAELRDQYEIGIGSIDVDLTDVDLPTGRTDLDIDVGMGEALVYVPRDACVTSDVEIGAGASDVFDEDYNGVDVTFAETPAPPAARPQLHIDAEVGVGAHRGRARGLAARPVPQPSALRGLRRLAGRAERGRQRLRVSRLDRTSLVAGMVTTVAGLVLLLDRLGTIDVRFELRPAAADRRRRRDPAGRRSRRSPRPRLTVPRWRT